MIFNVLDLSTRRTVARTAPQLRAEFDATGVLVFPAFYSDTELAAVRRELDAYFQPLAAAALEKARERVDLRKFACDVIDFPQRARFSPRHAQPQPEAPRLDELPRFPRRYSEFRNLHRRLPQRRRELLRRIQDA